VFDYFRGSTSVQHVGLIYGVHLPHLNTPHLVGLLWTSDRHVAETSTWQQQTLIEDRDPCPRWDSNPQSQPPQTHALYQAATGIGGIFYLANKLVTTSKDSVKISQQIHTLFTSTCLHRCHTYVFRWSRRHHKGALAPFYILNEILHDLCHGSGD
jgi:hypothetical protein